MGAEPDLFDLALNLLPFFLLEISSLSIALASLLILLLLIASAFVSSSEVAFFSLSPNDLEKLKSERESVPNTERLLTLLESPRTLLATILISNNFINIAIVIISEFLLGRLLGEARRLEWAKGIQNLFGFSASDETLLSIASGINFLIAVVGVTFLLVLFGEVAPKVYARLNNIRLAEMMAKPLTFLGRFFSPISNILVGATGIIERRFAARSQTANRNAKVR